jgi:hypothetical protein
MRWSRKDRLRSHLHVLSRTLSSLEFVALRAIPSALVSRYLADWGWDLDWTLRPSLSLKHVAVSNRSLTSPYFGLLELLPSSAVLFLFLNSIRIWIYSRLTERSLCRVSLPRSHFTTALLLIGWGSARGSRQATHQRAK